MNVTLHATTLADTTALPTTGRSTGQRFLPTPELAWVVEDQTLPTAQYRALATTGTSWLAWVDALPVGFLAAETLRLPLSITEPSLRLEWQGKGIGRRLIEYVVEWARKKGYTSLTLTTFRDMTRDVPRYMRLGFEILTDKMLPAKLRQKRGEEAAHGLIFESRCAMHLMLR